MQTETGRGEKMFDQRVLDIMEMFEMIESFAVICNQKGQALWANQYARKGGMNIDAGDSMTVLFPQNPQLFLKYMEMAEKKTIYREKIVYFGKEYELSVKGFDGEDGVLYSLWTLNPVQTIPSGFFGDQELLIGSVYRSELFRIFNVLIPLHQMLEQTGMYEAKDYLNSISRSGYKMLKTVINVTEYHKFSEKDFILQLESVNMHFFLRDLISQVNMLMVKSGKRLSFQVEDSAASCVIDSDKMTLAFLNLISNAIEFALYDSEIQVKLSRIGNDVVVSIRNEGDGISKENLGRVMEPFFSYDPAFQRNHGIGLGLPLAKEIIEAHGGSLLITSEENVKTVLTVRLPAERQKRSGQKLKAPSLLKLPMISDKTSPLYAFLAESCNLEWI